MPFVYIFLSSLSFYLLNMFGVLELKFLPQNAIVLLNFNYGSISMEPNLNNKIDTPGCVLMGGGIL